MSRHTIIIAYWSLFILVSSPAVARPQTTAPAQPRLVLQTLLSSGEMAISHDGKRIAVIGGAADHPIYICNLDEGTIIKTIYLTLGERSVSSVDFSPDDERVLVNCNFGFEPVICQIANGEVAQGPVVGETNAFERVVFSVDGKRVLSHSGFCQWNIDTNQIVQRETDIPWSRNVAYSADRRRAIVGYADRGGSNGLIHFKLVDVDAGVALRSIDAVAPENPRLEVAISADGQEFAYSDNTGVATICRASDGSPVCIVPRVNNRPWPVEMQLARDGKSLAAKDGYGTIRIYSLPDGKLTREADFHFQNVSRMGYSPDGKSLLFWRGEHPSLARVNLSDGSVLSEFEGTQMELGPALLDSNSLAFTAGGPVRVLDLQTLGAFDPGRPKGSIAMQTISLAFSPERHRLAIGSGGNNGDFQDLEIYSLEAAGKPLRPFTLNHIEEAGVTCEVAFSLDGKVLRSVQQNYLRQTPPRQYYWDMDGRQINALPEGTKWYAPQPGGLSLQHDDPYRVRILGPQQETLAILQVIATSMHDEGVMHVDAYRSWEWIMYTPDGHWWGSDGAAKYVSWQEGDQLLTENALPEMHNKEAIMAALNRK